MPFIHNLIWTPGNIAHIADHRVTVQEVEEVRRGDYIEQQSYMLRVILLGPTRAGKMLAVVLEHVRYGDYYVVTARPASRRERRLYQQQKGDDGHASTTRTTPP